MKLSPNLDIYPKISCNAVSRPAQKTLASAFRGQTAGLEIPKSDKLGVLKSLIFHTKTHQKIQKPVLDENLFFIRMKGYKKDYEWAQEMNELTYKISDMISEDEDFDTILKTIEENIENINKDRGWYGRRRKYNKYLPFNEEKRGCEYFRDYESFLKQNKDPESKWAYAKPNDKYKTASTCKIRKDIWEPHHDIQIIYPKVEYMLREDTNKAMNLPFIKQEYEELKSIKNPSLEDINRSVAAIHWLMAQGVPYGKGSDSIANLLTKSIYHAYGIKTSPAKEGKSFDFEAFYRDLEDYIKIYPDIFEIPPHRV